MSLEPPSNGCMISIELGLWSSFVNYILPTWIMVFYVISHSNVSVTWCILYSLREVGHSRNASFNVWSCDVWQTLYKDSFGNSTWQNRQRSLSKETVSWPHTQTVSSEMCSFDDFAFVLLLFLDIDVLRCFEQIWFAWIRWNSSQHDWRWKQNSLLRKSSAVLFLIAYWSS